MVDQYGSRDLIKGIWPECIGGIHFVKIFGRQLLDWFLRGKGRMALLFASLSLFGQTVVYKAFLDKDNRSFN